jgi:hypothetical protein
MARTTGVYCSLLTGQEKRIVPFAEHISATVEMANLANVRKVHYIYVLLAMMNCVLTDRGMI